MIPKYSLRGYPTVALFSVLIGACTMGYQHEKSKRSSPIIPAPRTQNSYSLLQTTQPIRVNSSMNSLYMTSASPAYVPSTLQNAELTFSKAVIFDKNEVTKMYNLRPATIQKITGTFDGSSVITLPVHAFPQLYESQWRK